MPLTLADTLLLRPQTLATAKLSSLAVSSQAAEASTASPSAEPSTLESAQRSTASSGASTPDDVDTSDKADTTIEIAAVVRVPEASPSPHPALAAAALEPHPSAPRVLARSDSLKGRPPPAPAPAPALPAAPPAPPVEPVPAPPAAAARAPELAPAPQPRSPRVVPIWRAAPARQQDVVVEKRMTRAWLELEDALQVCVRSLARSNEPPSDSPSRAGIARSRTTASPSSRASSCRSCGTRRTARARWHVSRSRSVTARCSSVGASLSRSLSSSSHSCWQCADGLTASTAGWTPS